MKKKSLIFFAAFLAVVCLIYVGCKKEKIVAMNGNPNSEFNPNSIAISTTIPTISDPRVIERQLRWIARGIPELAQNNSSVKTAVETIALNPIFFAKNEDIQYDLQDNLTINYQGEVHDNVNSFCPALT